MRGVEERGAARGAVMGEELQAKEVCPSASTSRGINAIASKKAGKFFRF